MKVRVALFGYGYWGRNLLRVFSAQPGVEVCAVIDCNAPQADGGSEKTPPFEKGGPGGIYSDRAIDAVIIATPPSTHYELARAALEAGKHCWVEKPLAMSIAQGEELVRLAARSRSVLFVDETFLYDPLIRTAREWIRGGRLGTLQHLSFERTGMGRIRRDSDVWWNSAPHDLSILRYFSDAGVRSFRVDRFAHLQPGIADMCTAALRLDDGVSVHVYLSWLSPLKAASVIGVGTRGMFRYEGRFGQRSLTYYDYAVRLPPVAASQDAPPATTTVPIDRFEASETVPGGGEEPLELAARAFLECVRTGATAPSDGVRSLRVLELLERGDRASRMS